MVLAASFFWVSVLADCLLNEPNDGMGKLVWVLAIVLTFVIGAAIYHLGRRPRRIQEQTR
jgi:peptidoglycan/LPS O-acetylase OafA/YrhL